MVNNNNNYLFTKVYLTYFSVKVNYFKNGKFFYLHPMAVAQRDGSHGTHGQENREGSFMIREGISLVSR